MHIKNRIIVFFIVLSSIYGFFGCNSESDESSDSARTGAGNSGTTIIGVAGTVNTGSGGSGSYATADGKTASGGSAATTTQTKGVNAAGGSSTNSSSGGAGGNATGDDDEVPIGLPPTTRNPKYKSFAIPMGEPIPSATPGTWTWIEVEGALSRDGSPAGFYNKFSKTGNKNLLIYLVGGGVCPDSFFCNMNPPNKEFSLTAENVGSGVFNIFGADAEPQDPNGERWNSGIFKDDPANPVRNWNMVFIPYVTGDIYFGSKPNATIEGVEGTFQFVGKNNMLKFIGHIVPTYKDRRLSY